MPEVGDKKFPYTPEGKKQAKAYSERTGQEMKLEDSIPTQDASNRGQNYQIGGKIPGQEGFGLNPDDMNNIQTEAGVYNPVNPRVSNEDEIDEVDEGEVDEYKKGGKVSKYERKAKRAARRKNRKERRALKKMYNVKSSDIRKQARKGSKEKSVQEHYGTEGDRRATKKAIKAKLKEKRARLMEYYESG